MQSVCSRLQYQQVHSLWFFLPNTSPSTVRQTLTFSVRLQVWLSLQSASRPDCFLDELQVFYDKSTGR